MKSTLLLGALEELELISDVAEPDDDTIGGDDDLDTLLADVMEADREFVTELRKVEKEAAEVELKCSAADAAIERLEGIRDALLKHGISRPMMEAVDPNCELVAAGLCCTYEELGELPDKGIIAEAAAEAIASTFIISYLVGSALGAALAGVIKLIAQSLESRIYYEKALVKLSITMNKSGAIDEDKFKSAWLNCLKQGDFNRAVSAGDAIIKSVNADTVIQFASSLEQIIGSTNPSAEKVAAIGKKASEPFHKLVNNADVKDILGIHFEFNEAGILTKCSRKSPKLRVKGTASELGWNASQAKSAVKSSLALVRGGLSFFKRSESACNRSLVIVTSLKKKAKIEKTYSSEDRAAYSEASRIVRALMEATRLVTIYAINALREVSTTAIAVGNASLTPNVKK